MNTWNRIREKLFPPPEARWLVWVVVPIYFLACSAIVLLIEKSPFHAGSLFLALAVQFVYAITGNKSLFLAGFFGFIATVTYLFWLDWNIAWLATLSISLYLGYEITGRVQTLFLEKETVQNELGQGVELWKTRFETLREKMSQDKEVWEGEISKHEQTVDEKKKEMDSLRVLIAISHKETRFAEEQIYELRKLKENSFGLDLHDIKAKYEETKLLLEKANQALDAQEEALRNRQTINELLQTKRSSKNPISLKDLSK